MNGKQRDDERKEERREEKRKENVMAEQRNNEREAAE